MSLRTIFPAAATLAIPGVLFSILPSQAVSFRFDFDRNMPDELQRATEDAASAWSSLLKDNEVIDIKVEYTDLSRVGGSILGGAQTSKVKVKYEDYTKALVRDAVSRNDFAGLSGLQLSSDDRDLVSDWQAGLPVPKDTKLDAKTFDFLLDDRFGKKNSYSTGSSFLNADDSDDNKTVILTRAQAKALNLIDSKQRGLDAIIKINNQVSWDFNQRDGIDSDRYDAVSVMQHEIGHALGVVSGVDNLDFLAATNAPVDEKKVKEGKFSYVTPMDFYRYSEESADLGVMDLTLGGEKYFSLDGGESVLRDEFGREAFFSTGSLSSGGDGYQGSHWRETDGQALGVMNPTLQKGETNTISQLDLTLLDVVGWDTEDSTADRADAIGFDWDALTGEFDRDRAEVISRAEARWGRSIPGLAAAIDEAAVDIDLEFSQELQVQLDELARKTREKPEDRQKELAKFYEKANKAAAKRDEEISELPEDIYKRDRKVREWLDLSTEKLAKELEKAEGSEVNRLANFVKAMPEGDRARFEPRLEAALATFADKPDKLVEQLLDTSGPGNPIGFGRRFRWWFYWQQGEGFDVDIDDDDYDDDDYDDDDYDDDYEGFYDASYSYLTAADPVSLADIQVDSQPLSSSALQLAGLESAGRLRDREAQDIPEPSSVLALFGIAVLGGGLARKRRA